MVVCKGSVYFPLVTPQTPAPDVHFQSVFYLDVGSDSKGHLRLLFKAGGEASGLSAWNCVREPDLELDLVRYIPSIFPRILPKSV